MADGDSRASAEPSVSMKVVLSTVRRTFRHVHHLSTAQLAEWLSWPKGDNPGGQDQGGEKEKRSIILLDTRPVEEYVVSHLPGAVRVDPDLTDISGLLETLPGWSPTNTADALAPAPSLTVVCYCSVGYRSSKMAQRIQDYLRAQPGNSPEVTVYNLEGSLFKWANEARPMVDGNDQPTVYAHPYSRVWGRLLSKHLRRESPA